MRIFYHILIIIILVFMILVLRDILNAIKLLKLLFIK